jgi:hypothetical protein
MAASFEKIVKKQWKTRRKTGLPYTLEIWRNLLCDGTQPGTLHLIQEHKLPIGGIILLL